MSREYYPINCYNPTFVSVLHDTTLKRIIFDYNSKLCKLQYIRDNMFNNYNFEFAEHHRFLTQYSNHEIFVWVNTYKQWQQLLQRKLKRCIAYYSQMIGVQEQDDTSSLCSDIDELCSVGDFQWVFNDHSITGLCKLFIGDNQEVQFLVKRKHLKKYLYPILISDLKPIIKTVYKEWFTLLSKSPNESPFKRTTLYVKLNGYMIHEIINDSNYTFPDAFKTVYSNRLKTFGTLILPNRDFKDNETIEEYRMRIRTEPITKMIFRYIDLDMKEREKKVNLKQKNPLQLYLPISIISKTERV